MAYYIVSYDLLGIDSSKPYEPLEGYLRGQSAIKIQRNLWAISSDKSAAEIHEGILGHMPNENRLLVSALTDKSRVTNPEENLVEWLVINMPTNLYPNY